jgi:glycosyltransferase involved in cell wall biosynthesis
VIADSQSTKRDLLQLLGADESLIDVVPLGLGAQRRAQPLHEAELRERLRLGSKRALLTLSAKRPHKNLLTLIGALARIPQERRPKLIMPGYPTWHEQELRRHAEALGVADDLLLLGWVSEPELEGLWQLADAFVYPSLYEGFGLPVLEAMARGVPVACSNASSLPEVAGDAAMLFDPRSESKIAAAIERLLSDESEAERLRRAGIERAKQFTWERTARLTLHSYRRAIEGDRSAAR